ncbi:myb/SANT-like DNA-binding domain-containing protein 4 isoform X2 [Maniola hyperantus]|uniref:myb/SANT-like DNA-binding domain-containing protein 4 isoform X2 n=1 Tax=Aphantopus hyperantus TaxID=2795564 RepID=UPI0037488F51
MDNEDILVTSHNRCGNFSHEEVKALVEQVKIHKDIILNKCTNSAVNFAKEEGWRKICKEINKRGFKHKRTVENLKTKWLNLKRLGKKVSQNIIDVGDTNLDDVLTNILMLMNETDTGASLTAVPMDGSENNTNGSMTEAPQEDSFEAVNDMEEEKEKVNLWSDNAHNQSDESDDAEKVVPKKRRRVRTLNFTPSECSLLLKCVREEKDSILIKGKGISVKAINMQNSAWNRITQKYNRLSPHKRTYKTLRTKFDNMKRLTNRVNFKNYFSKNKGERIDRKRNHHHHERLDEKHEDLVEIKYFKTEPMADTSMDKDSDVDNEEYPEIPVATSEKYEKYSDPLSIVLNGDSGMESMSHFGSYTPHENKEISKLKLELLKYQLETAKLERQRISEALEAENSERQSKAIETSLRLRAARLDAVASESKLPSTHPALQYSEQEKLAQQYMRQFEHTCNCMKSKIN